MDLFYTVPAAIGLGALHSLEPGHGKGILAAYLVSSHAKVKDAIFIGIVSAAAHTLSIILLAFAASSAVELVVPQQITHWIELLSGLIITLLGSRVLYQQARPRIMVVSKIGHDHMHNETHEHEHHHHHGFHHYANEKPTSIMRLFTIGFFTGLIPCPSAMAILLAAVSAHQIPSGMALVLAFSIGGALAMSTIGVLITRTGAAVRYLEKRDVVHFLSMLSSFIMIGLGGFVIFQSLNHLALMP